MGYTVFQIMIIIAFLLTKKFVLIFTPSNTIWECLFPHSLPTLNFQIEKEKVANVIVVVVLICIYLIMCEVEHGFYMFMS